MAGPGALLAAAEIGVEVVVVVEVVVEVGLAVVAAGIVEVLVGEGVGLDVLTSPCELGLDAAGREVVVVSRGVELLVAAGAVVDVVDVDNDPPLSVRPFALEPMVDVVEVG